MLPSVFIISDLQLVEAMKAKAEVSARLDKGEQLPRCRYCAGIGALAAEGVRIQPVQMDGALITLFSSSDTALVREIQNFGTKAMRVLPSANSA